MDKNRDMTWTAILHFEVLGKVDGPRLLVNTVAKTDVRVCDGAAAVHVSEINKARAAAAKLYGVDVGRVHFHGLTWAVGDAELEGG